jgi:hypothetical protein
LTPFLADFANEVNQGCGPGHAAAPGVHPIACQPAGIVNACTDGVDDPAASLRGMIPGY